jgi:hypothetical protein
VFFLMGNDENTVKVAKRAAELGVDPKSYCDDMARQFQEVWRALNISQETRKRESGRGSGSRELCPGGSPRPVRPLRVWTAPRRSVSGVPLLRVREHQC